MVPPAKRKKVDTEGSESAPLTLTQVNAEMRLKTLQAENEKLKKQLSAPAAGAVDEVKYSLNNHAKFLNLIQKSNSIRCLDLSALERKTESFTVNWKWKPDGKLNAITTMLSTADLNVKELNLGDAKWASEEKYAKELLKILRHIKKNVTTLRCTSRVMVELVVGMKVKQPKRIWWSEKWGPLPPIPCTMTAVKVNVLDTLGSMQNLSKLKIVFGCVDEEKNGYGGELNTESYKKKLFQKVTELEIHLTEDWFASHVGIGKPKDGLLVDVLTHWKGVITFLDMNTVRKSNMEPIWFMRLVPELHALRSIAVRAELLYVSKVMGALEVLGLLVEGAADVLNAAENFVMEEVVPRLSLQKLKRVEVRAAPGYDKQKLDKILAALSDSCAHLVGIKVNDRDWEQ